MNNQNQEHIPIGPNPCYECGWGYGEHRDGCTMSNQNQKEPLELQQEVDTFTGQRSPPTKKDTHSPLPKVKRYMFARDYHPGDIGGARYFMAESENGAYVLHKHYIEACNNYERVKVENEGREAQIDALLNDARERDKDFDSVKAERDKLRKSFQEIERELFEAKAERDELLAAAESVVNTIRANDYAHVSYAWITSQFLPLISKAEREAK